jgi:hypothetical protein
MQISSVSSLLGTQGYCSTYNCRTDPNENTNNEVVFSFWSVLRLLLGNENNEVVFSFWSVLRLLLGNENNGVMFSFWSVSRLLPGEEEVGCYLLSERPHESGNILDKSTRIAKG